MAQQLNFNEDSASRFSYCDEYDDVDIIPTEFVKVEHIDELLVEDSEPGGRSGEGQCSPPRVMEDPLAPDPETDESASLPEIIWPPIKKEPPEEEAEEVDQNGEKGVEDNNAIAEAAAAFVDDDEEEEDPTQSRGRITRSRLKQSSQNEKSVEETRGETTVEKSRGSSSFTSSSLSCPICERHCGSLKNLEQHMNGHTGEKPYICDICGIGFSWEGNMRRHVRKVHRKKRTFQGATRPAAHSAANARRASTEKANAKSTRTTAAPYSAEAVTSSTTSEPTNDLQSPGGNDSDRQQTLHKNMANDSSISQGAGIRVFDCPVCGKRFSNLKYLNQHMNVHTGERPYECTFCGVTFRWESNLFRHERKHKSCQNANRSSESASTTRATPTTTPKTETTVKICRDTEAPQSYISRADEVNTTLQHASLKHENNNQGSKRVILDHLRRHTAGRHLCSVCGRNFPNRWYLDRHVNTHTGERPFHCPLCEKAFFWECNLKSHLCVHMKESDLNSVEKARPESPQNMNGSQSSNSMSAAEPIVDKDDFESDCVSEHSVHSDSLSSKQCSVCSKKFSHLASLKRHMLVHKGIKPFSCLVCGKMFSRKDYLQTHCRTHYKKAKLKIKNKKTSFSDKIGSNKDIHPKSLKTREIINEIISKESVAQKEEVEMIGGGTKMHQQLKTKKDVVKANESARNCSVQRVVQEKYQCIMCPKQTNSKAAMLAHMQKHMGGNRTQCSICGKKIAMPWNLPRHMLQHTGEKLFQCTLCKKRFGRREHLRRHRCPPTQDSSSKFIASQDTQKCKICKKIFETEDALQKHELQCQGCSVSIDSVKHPDTRGVGESVQKSAPGLQNKSKRSRKQCNICKKTFCSQWYMKQHLATHSGDKPFACGFCSRTFSMKACYRNHLKLHKRTKRKSLEEKMGETIQKLQKPTNSSKERQNTASIEILYANISQLPESDKYACSFCGRSFKSKAALFCHDLRHQGKRDSICNICNKKLSSSRHLVRHMLIHTGEKLFHCEVCERKFAWKESWQKHTKSCTQKPIKTSNWKIHKRKNEYQQEERIEHEEIILKNVKMEETISRDNLEQVPSKKDYSLKSQMVTTPRVAKKYPDKKFHCKICDKKIFTHSNFLQHMQTHAKKENFSCTVCKKIFSRRETLKIHMKSHTNMIDLRADKIKTKISSGKKFEKQKEKVDAELTEELLSTPKDLLSDKSTPSNRTSTVEYQAEDLYQVNHPLKVHNKATGSDFSNGRKVSDKNITQKIDADKCNEVVDLLETNQNVPQGNSASQDRGTKGVGPPSKRTADINANESQSSEKCVAVMQHEHGTNEGETLMDTNTKDKTCELCGKVFTQHQKLQRHLMNQSCLGPFECNVCHKKYSYKGPLDRHMLLHSEDPPKQKDVAMETVSSLQSLQEPEVIIIDSRSPSPAKMDEDMSIDNQQRFPTAPVNNIKRNLNYENAVIRMSPEKTPLEEKMPDSAQAAETVCRDNKLCDTSHGREAENQKSSVEMVPLGESKIPQTLEAVVTSPGKSSGGEVADVDVSEVVQSFHCDICKQTFDTQRGLLSHSHIHVSGPESQIKCKFCPLTFISETSRLEHLHVHLKCTTPDTTKARSCKQGVEQCNICGERYTRNNLVKHMSVHTGGISFQCSLCNQLFCNKTLLQKHSMKHDQKIEIHFLCHMCGQKLYSPSALKDHVQTHSDRLPFCCRVCGENFSNAATLQAHVKSHTGEKRFLCKICRKRFALKINYLKHLNWHDKSYNVVAEAPETPERMSEKRAAIGHRIQLGQNCEREDKKSSTSGGARKNEALGAETAGNCTSRSSTVEGNYKEKSLASLVEATIRHVFERSQVDNRTGVSSPKPLELESVTQLATDSPIVGRETTKGQGSAKTSPYRIGEDREKKCQPSSDEAQRVERALGMKNLEVEIKAISDVPKPRDKQMRKPWPVPEIVISGESISERRLNAETPRESSTSCEQESGQRKTVSLSEILAQKIIAQSNLPVGETGNISTSSAPYNCVKKSVPSTKPVTYGGVMPSSLEVRKTISGGTSALTETNRNVHDSVSQKVNTVLAQNNLQLEVAVSDDTCKIPDYYKKQEHEVSAEALTNRRIFSEKFTSQNSELGNGQRILTDHSRMYQLPADTEISTGKISKKGLDMEVEIVQETVGGSSIKPPKNFRRMDSVSYTGKETGEIMAMREKIGTTNLRYSDPPKNKPWQSADKTITRRPLPVSRPVVEGQEAEFYGSSKSLGNNGIKDIVKSVESQKAGPLVNKDTVEIVEIIDVDSENEESPSGSTITISPRPGMDKRMKGSHGQTEDVFCTKVADQMEKTEFSRSSLVASQFLPSIGAEMSAQANVTNAQVNRQIDNCATKTDQLAHATTNPLMQNYHQKPRAPLQSRLQMPDSWKETPVMSQADCRELGSGIPNIDSLVFAQPPGPWYGVPPSNYAPGTAGFFGWMPQTHSFPTISPPNSVYMTKLPPPYPENNIFKSYPPPAYTDPHIMQLASSHEVAQSTDNYQNVVYSSQRSDINHHPSPAVSNHQPSNPRRGRQKTKNALDLSIYPG